MKHFLARAAPWKIQKSLHSRHLEESKERVCAQRSRAGEKERYESQ
jgi:hypothetical protein